MTPRRAPATPKKKPLPPAADRMPEVSKALAAISRVEARRRKKAAREAWLGPKLIAAIEAAVLSGAPLNAAYEFNGVSRNTAYRWMKEADAADRVPAMQRTALQRHQVDLRDRVRRASAEAMLRVHSSIAQAGGLTAERPRSTVVRQVIKGATLNPDTGRVQGGEEGDVVLEIRELPVDWRAAAHIGKTRFPEEMGGPQVDTTEAPTEGGTEISSAMLWDRLQQVNRDKEARDAKAIDVESTEIQPARSDG